MRLSHDLVEHQWKACAKAKGQHVLKPADTSGFDTGQTSDTHTALSTLRLCTMDTW